MENIRVAQDYVVCISNEGYAASLEPRKIYRALPDAKASDLHMLRIIDESGEDYLYPDGFFMPIELPQLLIQKLSLAV